MEILKKHIYLFAFLLVFFACEEREEPQPINGTPEFYLIGEFNGEAFEYYAGEEGFINNAFSYTDNSDNKWYSASFGNQLNESFSFEINLAEVSANSNNLIQTGNYSSQADTIRQQYEVQFQAPVTNPGATFLWDFRDGTFSNEKNPIYYFPFEKGAYEVCLNILYPDSCTAQICQTIKPHLQGKLDIISANNGSDLTILSPQIQGFEAIKYEWTLSNGQKSQTKDIAVQNSSTLIEACLEVTNRKSEVYERCIQIIPAGLQNVCTSNFDYETAILSDTISSGVVIGQFSSNLQFSGTDFALSNFDGNRLEILSVEPYLTNESGEKTQKISFTMDVRLKVENGNFNYLKISEGVLAIGAE